MADYMAGNVPVWICAHRGIVHAQREWSETSVSSFGGGGYVGSNGGYVSAPKISSETHRYNKFWIVSPDGDEKEVNAPEGFSCREGHEVIVLWGAKKNIERGPNLLIRNLTTGKGFRWRESGRMLTHPGGIFLLGTVTYFGISAFLVYIWLNSAVSAKDDSSPWLYAPLSLIPLILIFGLIRTLCKMRKNEIISINVVYKALEEELAEG